MSESPPPTLDALTATAQQAARHKGLPPVHLWNPSYCGEIDMRIAADGTWFYNGTPIGRPALVRLFSTILRKDPERFVLVTPVERVGIVVEDAPFIGIDAERQDTQNGPLISITTNVGDVFELGPDHPLRFAPEATGGQRPYALVRGALEAKIARPVFYRMVEWAEERDGQIGLVSQGTFFPIIDSAALEHGA
ncbi:DUF1285 domain-containing protein [Rhizobiales bacterium TNE-4]|nr:DUF1285 domain-containing protein [Rhizobiales bacterium TNE-4]MBV1827788.1 DUF1285 domain-containing protein [Rhizobiales bacterium TNE-4]